MDALKQAIKTIERRRQQACDRVLNTREKLLADPEFSQAENALRSKEFERARLEVYGLDTAALDQELSALRAQRLAALNRLGCDESALKPRYTCAKCSDTGMVSGVRCECAEAERMRLELIDSPELIRVAQLKDADFDIYGNSALAYKKCAAFIRENLVLGQKKSTVTLSGGVGVGKSYLAAAALRECLANGESVCFINAIKLNKLFLDFHLAPMENKLEITKKVTGCAALVIDDLGVEQIYNNVTLPYFYELIIERFGKKTLITTNLSPRDIESRYGQRIFSRLFDKERAAFISLSGEDLRFRSGKN